MTLLRTIDHLLEVQMSSMQGMEKDEYMRGMYNGMEMIRSVVAKEEPIFVDKEGRLEMKHTMMYVTVNDEELPVYSYEDDEDNGAITLYRPQKLGSLLAVEVTEPVYPRCTDAKTVDSIRSIEDTKQMMSALVLEVKPTVSNWYSTNMNSYVAKYVSNGRYPEKLCNIIREEYPEWFI